MEKHGFQTEPLVGPDRAAQRFAGTRSAAFEEAAPRVTIGFGDPPQLAAERAVRASLPSVCLCSAGKDGADAGKRASPHAVTLSAL